MIFTEHQAILLAHGLTLLAQQNARFYKEFPGDPDREEFCKIARECYELRRQLRDEYKDKAVT